MKKQFFARLFASLAATVATTFLFAQLQSPVAAKRFDPDAINAIVSPLEKADLASGGTGAYVKAKVMRSFLQLFHDAAGVKWSLDNGRYFVSFTQAGKMCKASFDGQGGLVFSLRYSGENDLPYDVRRLIKSTYIDFTIRGVTEVDTDDLKAWVVNLTDSDNLIVVSVVDGSLNELQHYKTHF